MLADIFGSVLGKWIVGGVAVLGLGAVIYILVLQGQIKDRDLSIVRQQQTIQAQHNQIESLKLQAQLQEAANEILNERLKARQLEIDILTDDLEAIYSQGEENDGPVAPVLDGIVRDSRDRPAR